jgi:hypothetical protein
MQAIGSNGSILSTKTLTIQGLSLPSIRPIPETVQFGVQVLNEIKDQLVTLTSTNSTAVRFGGAESRLPGLTVAQLESPEPNMCLLRISQKILQEGKNAGVLYLKLFDGDYEENVPIEVSYYGIAAKQH